MKGLITALEITVLVLQLVEALIKLFG